MRKLQIDKQIIKREIILWLQYFCISLVSVILAYDIYITDKYGPPQEGVDINFDGLVRQLFYGFLGPWLVIFLILSAIRIALLVIIHSRKNHS